MGVAVLNLTRISANEDASLHAASDFDQLVTLQDTNALGVVTGPTDLSPYDPLAGTPGGGFIVEVRQTPAGSVVATGSAIINTTGTLGDGRDGLVDVHFDGSKISNTDPRINHLSIFGKTNAQIGTKNATLIAQGIAQVLPTYATIP